MLVCQWLMFHFTEYVDSPLVRHQLGWYYLYFVALNVCLNVLVLVYVLVNKIYQAARRWFIKRKKMKLARMRVHNRV